MQRGDQSKTGIGLEELLSEGGSFREGSPIELIDYFFLQSLRIDFTSLPIPRIMGLIRQMRIDSEKMKSESLARKNIGRRI